MEDREFLEKFDDINYRFTENEVKLMCWGEVGREIDKIDVDEGRWTKTVETIFKVEDRYFSIYYQQGLTEYQESEYYEQPIEVKPIEKIIKVIDWIPVK